MAHVNPSAALLAALLTVSAPAVPAKGVERLSGRVAHVVDGDTLDVVLKGKRTRVRLADVEAPKTGSPNALRSRQSLVAICGGEVAAVELLGPDAGGLARARVYCGGLDANGEQIRRGMARVSDRRPDADAALLALEREAKAASRGIWVSRAGK